MRYAGFICAERGVVFECQHVVCLCIVKDVWCRLWDVPGGIWWLPVCLSLSLCVSLSRCVGLSGCVCLSGCVGLSLAVWVSLAVSL